ncbi:MAG: hypothetical protein WBC22_11060, partial [Sedimentisphaerales bacterium]
MEKIITTRTILDQLVWDAHFQRLQHVTVSPEIWRSYWLITRHECRGYWHGATGLIAERLAIGPDEWNRMINCHQSADASCLGDSSHDYSYLIEKELTSFT